MSERRTRLLVLLVVVSALCATVAYARMARQRDLARDARADLAECQALIAQLTGASSTAIPAAAPPDLGDLNRRIRAASTAAGLPESSLPSIESRQPMPVENSDLREMALFLGFDSMTLEQLATFLHRMTGSDRSCTVETIELSVPETPDGKPADTQWRADLQLTYLVRPGNPGISRTPVKMNEEDRE